MEPEPTVLDSLRKAVEAMPDDVPLRLHLASMLLQAGQRDEAVRQLGAVLQRDPGNAQALGLLQERGSAAAPSPAPPAEPSPGPPADPSAGPGPGKVSGQHYDWPQAEDELRDVMPAMFVGDGEPADSASAGIDEADAYDAEHTVLTLADVAGMTEVKQRLEAAFLAPMRNPELRKLYGKSLRGGLLLYGPPGCGKTFIARATAGELGARFMSIGLSDVLDMWLGQSERNLHEIFETARRNAPCVLFFDELDALGQKRALMREGGGRNVVNHLLADMDSIGSDNDGVFVLSATNHPWDVDSALRRPGRFDRVLLVLPPDRPAREAILKLHLRERPVGDVDIASLAAKTDDFSGADLAHLCESAAELAMEESITTGNARPINQSDFKRALGQVKPSTRTWFDTARNYVQFANEGGMYDDLMAYMRTRRLL